MKLGKVIFSEVCVKNSVHMRGGGCLGPASGGCWGVWQGVSRPTQGVGVVCAQAQVWGYIPACTEADTPPPKQTATAVGGMHPTGMHSY